MRKNGRIDYKVSALIASGIVAAGSCSAQVHLEIDKLRVPWNASGSTHVSGVSMASGDGVFAGKGSSTEVQLFDSDTWQHDKTIEAPFVLDLIFGHSIAVDSGLVLVGAPRFQLTTATPGAGYLFDAESGEFLASYKSDEDNAADQYGASTELGHVIVVGAPKAHSPSAVLTGAVYVYQKAPLSGVQKLYPADGVRSDLFGGAIALDGNILAVGACAHDVYGLRSGAVYVFDVDSGEQLLKLFPDDGASTDEFGGAVDLADGLVVVGAVNDDDNGSRSGSAYVFDATTGEQLLKLTPDDGAANDNFGSAVAIQGGQIAVSAILDDDKGESSGAVYLFDATTGDQILKLIASDGIPDAQLGTSLVFEGQWLMVGRPGAIYRFPRLPRDPCDLADTNRDGNLGQPDFTAWVDAFNEGLPECDQNADGQCTPTDFTAWIANFSTGC